MDRRIGELLVEAGVLTQKALDAVLEREVVEGEARIASEIYALGLAHERQLCEALARRAGHPAVVLTESTLDTQALSLVPRIIAERNGLLAVAVDEDTITVAVPDVENTGILDQIQFAAGRVVIPVLAVKKILEDAVGPAYDARTQNQRFIVGHQSPHPDEPHLAIVRDVPVDAGKAHKAIAVGAVEGKRKPTVSTPLDQLAYALPGSGGMGSAVDYPAPTSDQLPALRALAQPAPAAGGDALDILIAEDDEGIGQLLFRALEHDGYRLRVVRSGDEAAETLRRVRPRLLLLDAMLPGVHGFEICSRVKRSPAFEGVKVVMVSAVYRGFDQARDIQEVHGADAFVEKPFDVHYVRKLVADLLGAELSRNELPPDVAATVDISRHDFNAAFLSGDLDAAQAAVTEWIRADPFDGAAYLEQGNLVAHRGDLALALRAYEMAAVYAPRSYPSQMNLAMTYERLGFRRRARDTWRRAYELAPDDETRQRITERIQLLQHA